MFIDLGNRNCFNLLMTVSSKNRMSCKYWDTEPFDLIGVNLVSSAYGQSFSKTGDSHPGLKSMVRSDKTNVTASDNEYSVRTPYEISVDESLKRTRSINTRKGTSGKWK